MNRQDIFNRVVAHLLAQGGPSAKLKEGTARCLYRAPNGRACGIGGLIPDENYDPALENALVTTILTAVEPDETLGNYPIIRAMGLDPDTLDGKDRSFLGAVQTALHDDIAVKIDANGYDHIVDDATFIARLKEAIPPFAKAHSLTAPV